MKLLFFICSLILLVMVVQANDSKKPYLEDFLNESDY